MPSAAAAGPSLGLQGEEVSLGGGVQAYYAAPKASGRQMGVVVLHDVFGFPPPGCRHVVDCLAGKGYEALMPDLFRGKELSRPAWPSGEPLEGPGFAEWLGEITSEPFWGAARADVRTAMGFLRGKGCRRFGVVGFCWGGRAAEVLASGPGAEALAAAVSVHGVGHGASTHREVRCGNMLYIAVSGDPLFGAECQEEITAAGGRVRVFEGVPHGFAVSGDLADAEVRAAADEAMAEVEALLHEACLSRPRYTKVGSLRPGSSGASLLLKVLGGPAQAAGQDARGPGELCLEALCGDDTGQAIVLLTAAQAAGLAKDEVICVRDASVQMVGSRIRLVAGELGRAGAADAALRAAGEIGERNLSDIKYELASA